MFCFVFGVDEVEVKARHIVVHLVMIIHVHPVVLSIINILNISLCFDLLLNIILYFFNISVLVVIIGPSGHHQHVFVNILRVGVAGVLIDIE